METLEESDVVRVFDIYLDATLNKYILTLTTPVKKDGKFSASLALTSLLKRRKSNASHF